MKKLILFLSVSAFCFVTFGQQLGQILAPQQGVEIVEYIELKYSIEKQNSKIMNVSISNGLISEPVGREFKSSLELLNFLGRAGWAYLNESKTEEKGVEQYILKFSRKISSTNRQARMQTDRPGRKLDTDNQRAPQPPAQPQKVDNKNNEKK